MNRLTNAVLYLSLALVTGLMLWSVAQVRMATDEANERRALIIARESVITGTDVGLPRGRGEVNVTGG